MPRAYRYYLPGQIYHVTHRCHNRAYLLGFAQDKDAYRMKLFEGIRQFRVSVLSYCITRNHVHLLLSEEITRQVSNFMQKVQGEFAQQYNRKKQRSGAVWGGRYHATMIEGGRHLWSCMVYIDLNMVRAGAVNHPSGWKWTAWHELMGCRKRYRLIDINRLLEFVGPLEPERFREEYECRMREKIRRRFLERDTKWTESIAVGSRVFVERIASRVRQRMDLDLERSSNEEGVWILREGGLS
jgi:putative transposase